jgi:hypothetical protein
MMVGYDRLFFSFLCLHWFLVVFLDFWRRGGSEFGLRLLMLLLMLM